MDPKVLQLLKKIVAEPDRMTDVEMHENEFYFRYKQKLFSILRGPNRKPEYGEYSFYIYLVDEKTRASDIIEATLAGAEDAFRMLAFHSGTATSAADKNVFAQLYDIARRKESNIDHLLDDLLKD